MKIKTQLLKNIFEKCTAKEIDFIIHIGQFQDENGYIQGIYYKDVMKSLNISKTSFYKIIRSLEEKSILEVDNTHSKDFLWNFWIAGNLFVVKKDYKLGYLNLNHHIFHTEEFLALSKTAKITAMLFILRNRRKRNTIAFGVKDLMERTNRTKQSVMNAIKELSGIFKISVLMNAIEVETDKAFFRRAEPETEIFGEHILKTLLIKSGFAERRNFRTDKEALQDTGKLFSQYKKLGQNTVLRIVKDSLTYNCRLIPQYINSVLNKIFRNLNKKYA